MSNKKRHIRLHASMRNPGCWFAVIFTSKMKTNILGCTYLHATSEAAIAEAAERYFK